MSDISPGGTISGDRVADVLLMFARTDGPLGVSTIARGLGISKAVVHRILQSLVSRSLLEAREDSNYVLGPAVMSLGLRAQHWGHADWRSVAAPLLRELRDRTGETATLTVVVGRHRTYLEQYESPQVVKMLVEIGALLPLHTGASGRAILAQLPPEVAEESIGHLLQDKPHTSESRYRERLAQVRGDGYATSQNERNRGAASIAAPYFDPYGHVAGAISACGPEFRFTGEETERYAKLVVATAQQITADYRRLMERRASGVAGSTARVITPPR